MFFLETMTPVSSKYEKQITHSIAINAHLARGSCAAECSLNETMHNVYQRAFIKIERASFQVHFWTKLKTWREKYIPKPLHERCEGKGKKDTGYEKSIWFLGGKTNTQAPIAYEFKICVRIMVLFLPVFPFSQGNHAVPARRHFPNEKQNKTEKSLLDSPIESFDLSRRASSRLARTGLEVPHVRVHFSRSFISSWNLQTLFAV